MKMMSKSSIFIISLIFVVTCCFSAFATNVDTTINVSGTERKKPNVVKASSSETIIGKIASINAESVTIEVATRKERTKGEKNAENNAEREKADYEDRYVLTGETKTYNIASANFGKRPDGTKIVDNSKEKSVGIAMTYADYNVGDYIRITTMKDTPTVAKRVRNANQGSNVEGHYVGGYKGSYTGKTKAEKESQKGIS